MSRRYSRFLVCQSASMLGDQITESALPTIAILMLNASAVEAGALNAAVSLGYPLAGLFAGALTDRFSRRRLIVCADVIRLLSVISIPMAAAFDLLGLGQMYIAGFVIGTAAVFFEIAVQAYVPAAAGTRSLHTAYSGLEASRSVSQVAGPALSGFLIKMFGAPFALVANAAMSAVSVLGLPRAPETHMRVQSRPRITHEIRAGLLMVKNDAVLLPLALKSTTSNFGFAIILAVLPVFVYRGLQLDPMWLGIILTSGSLGACLGALFARKVTRALGLARTMTLGSVMLGVPWLFVPLSLTGEKILIMCLIAAISAFFLPVWNINAAVIRQSVVDDTSMGRVVATMKTLTWTAHPLGALFGAALAQGLSNAVGVGLGPALALVAGGLIRSLATLLVPRREEMRARKLLV
ncbi:MFS transporter [Streptomyces sp. NBC_00286]|uniref:MFS transporter n=1 Tax=Streptomyces sp. NBC_00286 TaxID=2975701 RepID=UPI002E2800E4|nr:MFS transporter [Streptomyces sp. NBC_00286]